MNSVPFFAAFFHNIDNMKYALNACLADIYTHTRVFAELRAQKSRLLFRLFAPLQSGKIGTQIAMWLTYDEKMRTKVLLTNSSNAFAFKQQQQKNIAALLLMRTTEQTILVDRCRQKAAHMSYHGEGAPAGAHQVHKSEWHNAKEDKSKHLKYLDRKNVEWCYIHETAWIAGDNKITSKTTNQKLSKTTHNAECSMLSARRAETKTFPLLLSCAVSSPGYVYLTH